MKIAMLLADDLTERQADFTGAVGDAGQAGIPGNQGNLRIEDFQQAQGQFVDQCSCSLMSCAIRYKTIIAR